MTNIKNRVHFNVDFKKQVVILPTFGVVASGYYKFRVAFSWLGFLLSIGIMRKKTVGE